MKSFVNLVTRSPELQQDVPTKTYLYNNLDTSINESSVKVKMSIWQTWWTMSCILVNEDFLFSNVTSLIILADTWTRIVFLIAA